MIHQGMQCHITTFSKLCPFLTDRGKRRYCYCWHWQILLHINHLLPSPDLLPVHALPYCHKRPPVCIPWSWNAGNRSGKRSYCVPAPADARLLYLFLQSCQFQYRLHWDSSRQNSTAVSRIVCSSSMLTSAAPLRPFDTVMIDIPSLSAIFLIVAILSACALLIL